MEVTKSFFSLLFSCVLNQLGLIETLFYMCVVLYVFFVCITLIKEV